MQDLRTVVLLRQQLGGARPRARPLRSLGMLSSVSPAWVVNHRGRDPFDHRRQRQ
jgi:hypothetical protein